MARVAPKLTSKRLAKMGMTLHRSLALLSVREMLAQGLLWHQPDPKRVQSFSVTHVPTKVAACRFNMSIVAKEAHCGTVGCIGGWIALITGRNPEDVLREAPAGSGQRELFYPDALTPNNAIWSYITPKMAVKAIDNFIETGRPKWLKAVGGAKGRDRLRKAAGM